MQQLKLEKINLTELRKAGFLGIDHFLYSSWDTLPKKEEYALDIYGDREPMIKEFPPRQVVAPNPNSLIFKHQPTSTKMYPPGASIWKIREAEMPFSTPLDLQQLLGLMCALNVVLPWDHTKIGEMFQI